MNRREFLSWMGVGGIASYLPVALAACSPQTEHSKSPASSMRSDGFESVGTTAELDQKGQILSKQEAQSKVLVVRNPFKPTAIIAVNPSCTHQGCNVEWRAEQKVFYCPCHGSKFAVDGKVMKGPAQKPLATYTSKIEANSILVKVNS